MEPATKAAWTTQQRRCGASVLRGATRPKLTIQVHLVPAATAPPSWL